FYSCYDLQKVTVGNNVQDIDADTFSLCESLVEIDMPGVEFIDSYSFYKCTSLKRIGWSESLKTIYDQAFYQCESLEEVVIPNSVTGIWDNAFWKCTNLKRVIIGSSVDYIGCYVFRECSSLQEVSFVDAQGWKVGVVFYRKIDVSDAQQNAKYFLDKHRAKIWQK
ncbi:MAG: leucine-rich repeat domain-containing protein, partial [Clostridia bacterium]|nr:leucine-rich repeat domain-containing protein [Clostridia bacterium]